MRSGIKLTSWFTGVLTRRTHSRATFPRFSYFPAERTASADMRDRKAIAIDVRESNTAKICKGNFYRIPIKGDREFILALMDALSGKCLLMSPKNA